MRRATSVLAAIALAAVGGVMVLQSTPATSGTFNGTISGGSGGTSSSGGSSSQLAFTSTQTDGGPGFCFNGSCGVSFSSDGGVVTLSGAELDATLKNSQNVNSGTDIGPHAVIAQAASGEAAFKVNQNGARYYFANSGNVYCYSDGAIVICASQWDIAAGVTTNIIGASTAGRNRVEMFYPQPIPLGSLLTCDATHMGVLQTLSGDGRTYQCNGTSNQTFGFRAAWTGALDFAVFASNTCQDLTFTATGAVANEPIAEGGCGAVFVADSDLTCKVVISATNTARVRVCCNDTLGCTDLSSITFTAAALR